MTKDRYEVAIGVFKLVKAGLLLTVSVGALSLLSPDLRDMLMRRISQLAADPHFHRLQSVVDWIGYPMKEKAELVSAGSFLYAALFAVEGVGLVRGKRWARYLTVIITGSFLPIEVYELIAHHWSYFKLVVTVANVAIVVYLIWRLKVD